MSKSNCPENCCPQCQHILIKADGNHKYCIYCDNYFIETANCPKCKQPVECITGCGAINYLCRRDGLVLRNKVLFNYMLTE